MVAVREWTLGRSWIREEAPGLVVAQFVGEVGTEEARFITEAFREAAVQQPFDMIAEVSRAGLGKKGREYFAQHLRGYWVRSAVYVGAGMVKQAAVRGLAMALYLTGRWTGDVHFVRTVEEARELLARRRTHRNAA